MREQELVWSAQWKRSLAFRDSGDLWWQYGGFRNCEVVRGACRGYAWRRRIQQALWSNTGRCCEEEWPTHTTRAKLVKSRRDAGWSLQAASCPTAQCCRSGVIERLRTAGIRRLLYDSCNFSVEQLNLYNRLLYFTACTYMLCSYKVLKWLCNFDY